MKDLAASGKTVVWQRKDRKSVVFTKDGAFQSRKAEGLEEFSDEMDKSGTW